MGYEYYQQPSRWICHFICVLTFETDTHFRIGGAAGSQLQAQDCPKLTGTVHDSCIAGALMLHITAESDGYFENIWAWTADHDIDSGLSQTQIDVYVARGLFGNFCTLYQC